MVTALQMRPYQQTRTTAAKGPSSYVDCSAGFGGCGILMARDAVDSDRAFDILRDHSQRNGQPLVDPR
jgi:hypothetical protein